MSGVVDVNGPVIGASFVSISDDTYGSQVISSRAKYTS